MPRKASGEFNQSKYINNFIKERYDRINLTMPKGKKVEIMERAAGAGKSVNQYINDLIDEDLNRQNKPALI